MENFSGENYLDTVKKELKQVGLKDEEELFDPETGKSLGKVHVGNPYILKLNKISDVNFSVRGEQGPVSVTSMQPTKGGEEGAKSLDMLTMYSMLSHGARANLQEMATIKSENNPHVLQPEDLWNLCSNIIKFRHEAFKSYPIMKEPQTPFPNLQVREGTWVRKKSLRAPQRPT